MKTYRTVNGDLAPSLLTSALDGGEWSALRYCRFNLGKRAPGTNWIDGRVDPRTNLDAEEKRKIFCTCQELKPGRTSSSLY
jgi:hypothetical protein